MAKRGVEKVYSHAIIGAGLLGSSVGYHLSRLGGGAICMLERGTKTDFQSRGNSQYSTGLITSSHKTALGRELVQQTFEDLRRLEQLGLDGGFKQMGCANVDRGDRTGARPLANILHFDGWSSVLRDTQPTQFEDFEVSEQFPGDGCVSPTHLADCYRKAAKATGQVDVVFGADVIHADGNGVITLTTKDGRQVKAHRVINAAGAWVDTIGAGPGQFAPIGLMRADYWMLKAPRPIPQDTPLLTLAGAYIKPAGSVVEIGTYRDEQLLFQHADDPTEEDPDLLAITDKWDMLQTFIPDLDGYRPMHYTIAKTTYTPDGMPVLGAMDGPLFTVSGCNGYGVTWSGGFGRVVAEAVLGLKPLPPELDARRFQGWTKEEVQHAASEKRRTKFGTWAA